MSSSPSANYPEQVATIKKLSNSAWKDADVTGTKVDRWLANFTGECTDLATEHSHAMHLLAQLIYFGRREIDECLRVLFEERIAYPFVQKNKKILTTPEAMHKAFQKDLRSNTRFVGVGNPAESGTSFLYRFRQVNRLPLEVFTTLCDAVEFEVDKDAPDQLKVSLDPPELNHLIFLDDFCGSGTQALGKLEKQLKTLRAHHKAVRISYFLLSSTQSGLDAVRQSGIFDDVFPVIIFDNDYKAFCTNSHYYRNSLQDIDQAIAKQVMSHYGGKLIKNPNRILGFGDCQLLLSFEHNTPNNTLPVIWFEHPEIPWRAVFPRNSKFS